MINGGLNPLTDTADDAVTAAGVEVKIEPKDPREELVEKISQMLALRLTECSISANLCCVGKPLARFRNPIDFSYCSGFNRSMRR